ncbi:Endonuclease/Exonuclease/phosphatase family protein [Flaviramulus basaltis]|uniref:Endonuclease/Exonuclease/phosphatase family protein n=1 Tax=Flaviramulus basaltis TaxID=369401 RepID=A0A1K2IDH6_9FLAO|nr:endonuclease [Flaviramulus basaltis]SFZ89755.1 Endonuclease/Exonuclease/phosphatase family protein [Flaviramulus basaltis]
MANTFDDIPVRDNMQTIAFYNLENLFDLVDDQYTNDNDFLPTSVKKWTPKRYDNKLRKLGFAISNIGKHETGKHPAIVGLAEVENAKVIEDLIASKHLDDCNYNYVHYDSLDERGIDVALLYDTNAFVVLHSEAFTVELFNNQGLPDYTRDILLVSGLLDGENVNIIVNHWSSRREGEKETEHKRIASSDKVGEIISSLRLVNPDAKIIIIGDFNDDPSSNSIKRLVEAYSLHNSMETLRSYNRGTSNHNRQWNLFDQILISSNFFKTSDHLFEYSSANIFDEDFLKLFNGKYKGTPFRTYVGKKYKGGYSDHFPVYAVFKK